jgi:hypothetical protein
MSGLGGLTYTECIRRGGWQQEVNAGADPAGMADTLLLD